MDDSLRRLEALKQRDRVQVVVTRAGLEHPGGVFHKSGDVIEITGLEASTFIGNGWCDLASSEAPL